MSQPLLIFQFIFQSSNWSAHWGTLHLGSSQHFIYYILSDLTFSLKVFVKLEKYREAKETKCKIPTTGTQATVDYSVYFISIIPERAYTLK